MIPDHSAFPLHEGAFPGLTKRELFAAMAMQGILSRSNTNWAMMELQLAEQSVRHADALIAELAKT